MGRKESEDGSTQKEQMVEDTGVDDVGDAGVGDTEVVEDVLLVDAEDAMATGADDVGVMDGVLVDTVRIWFRRSGDEGAGADDVEVGSCVLPVGA